MWYRKLFLLSLYLKKITLKCFSEDLIHINFISSLSNCIFMGEKFRVKSKFVRCFILDISVKPYFSRIVCIHINEAWYEA